MGYRTNYECTFCDFTTTSSERMAEHTRQSGHPEHRTSERRRAKGRSGNVKRRARREREQRQQTADQQRQQMAEQQRHAAIDRKVTRALGTRNR